MAAPSTATSGLAQRKKASNLLRGGAWTTWTFSLDPNARDGVAFNVRFDNNGTTDGSTSLVWFRDIMLCESDVPRAWAPGPDDDWS